MIQRLVIETLKLPHHLCDNSSISQKILQQHALIHSTLRDQARSGPGDTRSVLTREEATEQCGICGATIGLHSLSRARCAKGHQFGKGRTVVPFRC